MEKIKLGEITKIKTGKLDANASSEDGQYPFFTCSREPLKISTYSYDCECVLVAGNGDLNVKYYSGKFDAYQRTYIIEDDSNGRLYIPYLYYFMEGYIDELRSQSIGGVIKYIKLGNLTEAKIQLPSIEKQKEIVNILDKNKSIVDKRNLQLSELDNLIKSRFVEKFGDPVSNNMKWGVVKLKQLTNKIHSGNTPKGGRQVYVEKGIMFFRSQNVWKNKVELNDIAYIDEDTHKSMMKSSLKHKDILMTKTGRINTENSSLGRAAMYMGEDDQANVNGHVYLIRMKEKAVSEFILFIITTLEYRDHIRRVCVGGIDKRQLNKNHIEDFPIIQPPIEDQQKFVALWKQVDKLKVEVQKSLNETKLLFDSLMQEYFTK